MMLCKCLFFPLWSPYVELCIVYCIFFLSWLIRTLLTVTMAVTSLPVVPKYLTFLNFIFKHFMKHKHSYYKVTLKLIAQ